MEGNLPKLPKFSKVVDNLVSFFFTGKYNVKQLPNEMKAENSNSQNMDLDNLHHGSQLNKPIIQPPSRHIQQSAINDFDIEQSMVTAFSDDSYSRAASNTSTDISDIEN